MAALLGDGNTLTVLRFHWHSLQTMAHAPT
jgi:hypothetical protein